MNDLIRTKSVTERAHEVFSDELGKFPTGIKEFLKTGQHNNTWYELSSAYFDAFEKLADCASENIKRLGAPLFFLCRHSIELAIKEAIIKYKKKRRRCVESRWT